MVRHGDSMSNHTMTMEISRNLYLFAKSRYPLLIELPNSWPMIVKFLENYTPLICSKVVIGSSGSFKCNIDGSSRDNSGLTQLLLMLMVI